VALILRARERIAVPWKNGGGLTREVAVHPKGSDFEGFDWRVSIAEVHAASAFSCFAGVERHMAVLSGRLALSIQGRQLSLTPQSPPLSFAGDVPVEAEPQDGPVTDLNVMTRRARCTARLTRGTVHEPLRLESGPGASLVIALADMTLRASGALAQLTALDAVLIAGAGCELTAVARRQGAPY
jgi:hypothetical protein